MKIQELAIIFVIIILPISLLLSEYTQAQIQTISMQTEYDTKLTTATYDAIRAFQLNTKNETYSDIANQRLTDLEASINSFRNSLKSGFKLNGYTEDELNNYIPALVYTLYDGFYIYSPYKNIADIDGNILEENNQQQSLYGIKPYINYSCRYIYPNTTNPTIDVVITYTLDNYITVQGMIDGKYVKDSGYLVNGIKIEGDTVEYNGVDIEIEQLREHLQISNIDGIVPESYLCVKVNGTKFYLIEDYIKEDGTTKDCIISISNNVPIIRYKEGTSDFIAYKNLMQNNDNAKQYYKEAKRFTDWFNSTDLIELRYKNAYDEVINTEGKTSITQIWEENDTLIFEDNNCNIENKLSNFNQHRLAVIRHKIETNLAIAISNFNTYSGAATRNVFQMPELKETEWEYITNNISLISFLQGLHIGGKIYNGYSIVTNSESEEVVLEENIYILGTNNAGNNVYCRIGDRGIEDKTVNISTVADNNYGSVNSAGRLNLDFNRALLTDDTSDSTYYYYYPLKEYNASYDSVVMQNNVSSYDDIYEYVNGQSDELKKAFYTALGRERNGKYNTNRIQDVSQLYIPTGYKIVDGTNLENGVVIENDVGNQFVWVEVPRTSTVYPSAGLSITSFNDDNYTKIENDLKNYVSSYRKSNYKDEYGSNVLGLSETEYYNLKKRMLKSIYKNGGFYIGRYETGIDYSEPHRREQGETIQTPVIKQNAYPYNCVSIKQAQELSESLGQTGYTTSLMFGIQWDLTLKYLETKGVSQTELKTNSTSWGNHFTSSYNISNNNAKYSLNTGDSWILNSSVYSKLQNKNILITSGANEAFKKQNIYDLTGNMWEWTLETSSSSLKYIERGGTAVSSEVETTAHARGTTQGDSKPFRGFRTTLYKND